MSHFVTLQAEFEVKHEDSLVTSLKEVFGKTKVEVSDKGISLNGHYARGVQPCHVVVRGSRYDIGFMRQADGKYKVHHDSDDRSNVEKIKTVVKQNYVVQVAQKAMVLSGYTPEIQKLEDGRIQLLAYV